MSKHILIAFILLTLFASASYGAGTWVSPNHYRTLVTADMHGVANRTNSPVSLDIDFAQALKDLHVTGTFDEDTIEIVAYDSSGQPAVYDASRSGYERNLLPWRIENYYPITRTTLHFVMPGNSYTQYAVYFDTKESGLGKPKRYRGLVGDGDDFSQGYGRREINGNHSDCWVDIDGDGDLDLLKGGTEPYIRVYENVGGSKFIDRGRLTSGGKLLELPVFSADGNRAWSFVTFVDWDGDGDQDLLVSCLAGGYGGKMMLYENTTTPGGQLTFTNRGEAPGGSDKLFKFSVQTGMCFVDWFNTGKLDILMGRDAYLELHKNSGTRSKPIYDDKDVTLLRANGVPIRVYAACPEVADIDNDGDLDLFVDSDPGKVYFFENVGTRTKPVFAQGRLIVWHEGGYEDSGGRAKVADFDGDGLLDIVVGHHWERTRYPEQGRRAFGRMLKNVGTRTKPKFKAVTVDEGSPYTEQFQICDAVRQNSVRAADWNGDGKLDLIAGDTDGFVWYFQNLTGGPNPLFSAGDRICADGKAIHVNGEEERRVFGGYARPAVCDWNEDGKLDLLVASGGGWLWLYINKGTATDPVFGPGVRVCTKSASGESHPISGSSRASVFTCDWDNDGKKDLIFITGGEGGYCEFLDWPRQSPNTPQSGFDRGFLFYKNIGTNADPVLAYPEWITSCDPGGTPRPINFTRPTGGAFVDWNGDGVKDLIGCEFERNTRVWYNTTNGAPGVKPQFTSSAAGVRIVMPFSLQMMSNADAVDFNGDGDIDILTGTGHGGSGLRFWERDYINDFVNGTYPTATVGASERGQSPGDKK